MLNSTRTVDSAPFNPEIGSKNGQVGSQFGAHENVSSYDDCFRENQGRAPALQVSRLSHTSAASGVAYAETCGATTLSNWTDVGPKVCLKYLGNAVVGVPFGLSPSEYPGAPHPATLRLTADVPT